MDFLNQNPLFVVLTITMAVWLGVYWYLFRIERRLKDLETRVGTQQDSRRSPS